MDKFFLFSNLIFNYKFKKWFLVKNKKNTNFNNIRLFKKKKKYKFRKRYKVYFFFKPYFKNCFIKSNFYFLNNIKKKINWFIFNFYWYNLFFLINFFSINFFKKKKFFLSRKSRLRFSKINFSYIFRRKINYNFSLSKNNTFINNYIYIYFKFFLFLLDYYININLKNKFILNFKKKKLIFKLLFYFFSLYLDKFKYFFYFTNFNFFKFFFFIIKFFFFQLIYLNRFFFIFDVIFFKFRYNKNLKLKIFLNSFLKNNFFFKKKKLFYLIFYIFNLFKKRYNLDKKKLNLFKLKFFLFYFLKDFKKFQYLFIELLNIFKFYKKKNRFFRRLFKYKGIYFSKFYRKGKYIKFPPIIKYWKKFNYQILKNLFKDYIDFRKSYINSFIIKKYFISYFNFKNIKQFNYSKLRINKKFNFRVKNFFIFFELRISNILKKLGFVKKLFIYKNYENFICFNKYKKFKIYFKSKNYILKIKDLISLNFKYYKINRFYYYNNISFIETNLKLKSFYLIRYPYISEILKKWKKSIFDYSLYNFLNI